MFLGSVDLLGTLFERLWHQHAARPPIENIRVSMSSMYP